MLVIFSGGSGVGKNTVISELLKKQEYILMPTCTTRQKRQGESQGNPYVFLTTEQFEKKISDGEFYEYENVHGNYYGTNRKILNEALLTGKTLLKDIDVKGTHNLVNMIGNDVKLLTLFLKVDSVEVLKQRLITRGETEIEKRLSRYEFEQTFQNEYDYVINNYSLETTVCLVEKLIEITKKGEEIVCDNQNLDNNLVGECYNKLMSGELLSPIKVRIKDNKVVVVEGKEKFIASKKANKNIAKEIV